ncbi:OmpA family protein [Myxococcota bacterium]|nr:OmpA family protein [Myxococcota bacterium]
MLFRSLSPQRGKTRTRAGWLLSALFLCSAWLTSPVQAQTTSRTYDTSFQLQQFRPWGDINGMFHTQSGITLGRMNYMAGIYLNYALNPLVLRGTPRADGSRDSTGILNHQVGADIMGGFGILDWLDVYLTIPLSIYQDGSVPNNAALFAGTAGRDLSGFAFGDIKLGLKAQALRQDKHYVNLAFRLALGIPSSLATPDKLGGENSVSFDADVMLSVQVGIAHIGLNIGYRYMPRSYFLNLELEHELRYGLGVRLSALKDRLDIIGEIAGAIAFQERDFSGEKVPLDAYLGARIYPLSQPDLALEIGIGVPFPTSGYGSPLFRVFFGVVWSPKVRDTDGDGILDKDDRCPTQPGPRENDGCPDTDKDGDGIVDRLDKCPDKPGPKENKGCPWPDTDGDGLTDNVDKCPTQFGPKENEGCPWGDKDNDGVKDNEDKCPDQAGPKENQGCPWGDKDGDGLKDNEDKCPDQPGPKENQGCPDKDSDGDGIVDRLDKCPEVPGVKERQGCPKVVLVKVTKDKIEILQKIFFAFNRDTIQRKSFGVLDQVVSVLKSRPELRVRIEGHTDDRGRRAYNVGLSDRRAKSVRKYLIKKGIDEGRLEAKGFGPDKPIVANDTKQNRATNRRVEFNIINKDQATGIENRSNTP